MNIFSNLSYILLITFYLILINVLIKIFKIYKLRTFPQRYIFFITPNWIIILKFEISSNLYIDQKLVNQRIEEILLYSFSKLIIYSKC